MESIAVLLMMVQVMFRTLTLESMLLEVERCVWRYLHRSHGFCIDGAEACGLIFATLKMQKLAQNVSISCEANCGQNPSCSVGSYNPRAT